MKHFHQPVKNNLVTYDNIGKITTGQGDDCTTGSLLDDFYFKNYYKMIAIDLSKQNAVDDNLKGIQRIDFIANLCWAGNTTFFIIDEAKVTVLDFFTRNCESIVNVDVRLSYCVLYNLLFL